MATTEIIESLWRCRFVAVVASAGHWILRVIRLGRPGAPQVEGERTRLGKFTPVLRSGSRPPVLNEKPGICRLHVGLLPVSTGGCSHRFTSRCTCKVCATWQYPGALGSTPVEKISSPGGSSQEVVTTQESYRGNLLLRNLGEGDHRLFLENKKLGVRKRIQKIF